MNYLRILPISYHPSFFEKGFLEETHKCIVSRDFLHIEDSNITTLVLNSEIKVTVHEFSAIGDIIYLPYSLIDQYHLTIDSKINYETISPQKARSITIQPLSQRFFQIYDIKKELSEMFVNKYLVIGEGDIISLHNIKLKITKTLPDKIVSTYNSDPEIVFMENPEFSTDAPKKEKKERKPKYNNKTSIKDKYKSFSGIGNRLDK